MARITPILTSRKVLNITYQTPKETLLETPETLPTSEPANPQISYTVTEADLPTFNIPPYKKVWVAYLIVAGKCPTAATIYFQMLKNGNSILTSSSSVSANTFYTRMFWFYDVVVGDVLEIKLWSSVGDSNWDYKAYQIQVSRIILMKKPQLLYPCNFIALETHPVLTLGNPSFSTYALRVYHLDQSFLSVSGLINLENIYLKDTYGLFRIYAGDYTALNSSSVLTSSTYRPYYYRNYVPTQIVMRGLIID